MKEKHLRKVGLQAPQVLRQGLMEVGLCGLRDLLLCILLQLLRLLRFDAAPVLQHMRICDCLHDRAALACSCDMPC